MVGIRACSAQTKDGQRCGATPLRGEDVCFWHSPEHAEAAAEARRLGGMRRRREHAVAGAYEFDGLGSIIDIRRVVEIVVVDALGMENSVARGRLLIAGAQAATKLLEVGELEERLAAIEGVLGPKLEKGRRRR